MPESESQNLSAEIQLLERRLEELKKAHETLKGAPPTEKELLREAVGERIEAGLPLPPKPVGVVPPVIPLGKKSITHDELREVQPFVDIAFLQDIPHAVRAVIKSGNAHLIDAFHDVLVDRLYAELIKRGKLKG